MKTNGAKTTAGFAVLIAIILAPVLDGVGQAAGGYLTEGLIAPVADGLVRSNALGQIFVVADANGMVVNHNINNDNRAILEFPLTLIPLGSIMTSATLQLYVV